MKFNKIVGITLVVLLLTAAVHYMPTILSQQYTEPVRIERALFYVMQGAKGLVLYGVILWLLPKNKFMVPVWFAVAWAMYEDALVAGCRLAIGIENPVSKTANPWEGICEQTGMANYWLVIPPILIAATLACLLHVKDEHGKTLR